MCSSPASSPSQLHFRPKRRITAGTTNTKNTKFPHKVNNLFCQRKHKATKKAKLPPRVLGVLFFSSRARAKSPAAAVRHRRLHGKSPQLCKKNPRLFAESRGLFVKTRRLSSVITRRPCSSRAFALTLKQFSRIMPP